MRRVRITSDGTAAGSAVVDVETGEPIEGVVSVSWSVSYAGVAKATIDLLDVALDVVGEVEP